MPSPTGSATDSLRAFIEKRSSYVITRHEVGEIQLHRARLLATGARVEPLLNEYSALMWGPTKDEFVENAAANEHRVQAAAAILSRSPTTRIAAEHLFAKPAGETWRVHVDAALADGLFGIDDARAALEQRPNKGEAVELFMTVAGRTSHPAKELLLDAIVGPAKAPIQVAPTGSLIAPRLATTIDRLKDHVEAVESQVEKLEGLNAEKMRTIDSLVSQIEARKATIRDNYEDKRTASMLFAMFGAPSAAVVSMMAMERDDARLSELNRQLTGHRAEQTQVKAKLAEYERFAVPARSVLRKLESAARALEPSALAVSDTRLQPAAAPAARLHAGTKLVANLRSQLDVLEDLHGRAGSLNGQMTALISALSSDLRLAENMVAESRAEAHEVLQLMLDPDPETAARALLEARGQALMEQAQKDLGLKADAFVTELLKKAFPRGGAAADALKKQILAQF